MRKQFKIVDTADIGQAYHWKGDYEDFLTWYDDVKDSKRDTFIFNHEKNSLIVEEKTPNFPMSEIASLGDYIVKFPGMYLTVYSEEEFEHQLLILE